LQSMISLKIERLLISRKIYRPSAIRGVAARRDLG
jgi:hypothetical protein